LESPAHGKTIPYLPLLELLRNRFGIAEKDGSRAARQETAGELADALSDGSIQLFGRVLLSRSLEWQARLAGALGIHGQAVEIGGGEIRAEHAEFDVPLVVGVLRANVLGMLGRHRKEMEFSERLLVLLRRGGRSMDLSGLAADYVTRSCWVLGDAERARRFSSEALREAQRFGADRNVVFALLACGIARCLSLRWEEADGFLELARERIAAAGAGREWTMLIYAGALRVRVLCILGEPEHQPELEAQIAETLELIQRWDMKALLPLIAARASRTRLVARRRGRHGARSRRSAAPLRGDGRHRLGRVRAIDRGVTRSGA